MTEVQQMERGAGGAANDYSGIVSNLRASFRRGSTGSYAWRVGQLAALERLLTEQREAIGSALVEDLDMLPAEAWLTNVSPLLTELKHTRKYLKGWMRANRVNVPLAFRPGKAWSRPEPRGVALVISPWNYPVLLLLLPVIGAIAAGNCVVMKPSEVAPATSALLARLVDAYLDGSAIAIVEGGVEATNGLIDAGVDYIFFTGSTVVGMSIMATAARHLTPLTLELGGKSPVIVAADADLRISARRIAWAKRMNAGQTCVAPDYVLVDNRVKQAFVQMLKEEVQGFEAAGASASKIINSRHADRISRLLDGHGGSLVYGGRVDVENRSIQPTIILEPGPDSLLMQEEIFGPLLPVIGVDDLEDAIGFINNRPKPLALYVMTKSDAIAERVIENTSSGGVCINHLIVHLGIHDLPFGGVGPSGFGAYHGKAGFDAMSHRKSVFRKSFWPDPEFFYPPWSAAREKFMRWMLS